MSAGTANLNWLITRFVLAVPAVRRAVVVSSDGLALAVSDDVDRESADRLSAVASGMIGLASGSAGRFGAGSVSNVVVDIGSVAYQMALFSERAGEVLTPEVREELKAELVSTE